MEKNELYELEIDDIGNDGEGIGHVLGMAVFVKDAVIGDIAKVKIVKVKKNYAYGRLMEVITPSMYRVNPVCEKAAACGGCAIMQMSYERQLEYKSDKVKNCLKRIGGIENIDELMEPICGMEHPFAYRNKMQFPVGKDKDGHTVLGFYAGRTHSLIPLSECAIGHPINKEIIRVFCEFADKFNISVYDEEKHKGLLRHVLTRVGFSTGELMVCLIINGDGIKHGEVLQDMIEEAVQDFNKKTSSNISFKSLMININKQKTNKILGDTSKILFGQGYISDYIGNVLFHISPQSFFQVNPAQTKVLYDKALSYADLSGNEIVWDMYCGIGTISLFLAQKAKKVYGVEIVPQAIEDAKNNAELNNITNTEFYVGKAEEVVLREFSAGGESSHADVVVVDPPRKGCDAELLRTIISMAPSKVVYVSCDPATLARDVKYMTENGYEVLKISVVDQFGHSTHVETVVALHRTNS